MHSRIFQIGLKPIAADYYVHSSDFYDNSQDFADYIGDELGWEEKCKEIKYLAESLEELLDCNEDGVLVYKGMETFLADWTDAIHKEAGDITEYNILNNIKLYRLARLTDGTHKNLFARFYIENWNGYPAPASDFIEFLAKQKEGTKIYVGAVIDYHF